MSAAVGHSTANINTPTNVSTDGTSASDSAVTPYIILGHGHEEFVDFADRSEIPPGVTLVTLVEFGTPQIIRDLCPFLEVFADPTYKSLFEDPIANFDTLTDMLGRPLRIYSTGMKYPKLIGSLSFQFFMGGAGGTEVHYGPSGVYKFPLPLKILNSEGTEICEKYFAVEKLGKSSPSRPFAFAERKNIDLFLENAFSNSLMPTKEEVKSIFDAKPAIHLKGGEPDTLEKQLLSPIEEIWKRLGPGIYYFVICRSIKTTPISRSFEDIISAIMSIGDIDPSKYEPFLEFKKAWMPRLDDLYGLLKEDYDKSVGEYGKTSTSDEMKTLLDQIDHLRTRAPLLRASSNNQQKHKAWSSKNSARRRRVGGGRRKTRKGKRKSGSFVR